jgi:5-methylcytosine-specific restriction endonuclease McrA
MVTVSEALSALAAREAEAPVSKDPARDARKSFYASRAWRSARYAALKLANGRCQCCGACPADGARLCVDHIRPVRHHWHLRLEPTNFQVLCSNCNLAKASSDETDWRQGTPTIL